MTPSLPDLPSRPSLQRPLAATLLGCGLLAASGAVHAQASVFASIQNVPGDCGGSVATTPEPAPGFNGPLLMRSALNFSGRCAMESRSIADRGSLWGNTSVANTVAGSLQNTFGGNAGGGASWQEQITPVWPVAVALPGLARLRLQVQFDAGVSVGAAGSGFRDGSNQFIRTGLGVASADYAVALRSGGVVQTALLLNGTQRVDPVADSDASLLTQTGTWGRVGGVLDMLPSSGSSNDYSWGQGAVSLSLGISHFDSLSYSGGLAAAQTTVALRWLGVTGVEAFDAGGASIALPTGFALQLLGTRTGFDYWGAAAPVPEPGNWALLAAGLLAIGWRAGRRST